MKSGWQRINSITLPYLNLQGTAPIQETNSSALLYLPSASLLFVSELVAWETQVLEEDLDIGHALHIRGINIRYLGLVRTSIPDHEKGC